MHVCMFLDLKDQAANIYLCHFLKSRSIRFGILRESDINIWLYDIDYIQNLMLYIDNIGLHRRHFITKYLKLKANSFFEK